MLRLTVAIAATAMTLAFAGTAVASPEGGHHAPRGGGLTAITGDDATSAQATALVAAPGTVLGTYSVTHSCGNVDAAFAVEIKKADDTLVRVYEDASFVVLKTVTITAATGTASDGGQYKDPFTDPVKTTTKTKKAAKKATKKKAAKKRAKKAAKRKSKRHAR
jgi:hypothetical protein